MFHPRQAGGPDSYSLLSYLAGYSKAPQVFPEGLQSYGRPSLFHTGRIFQLV